MNDSPLKLSKSKVITQRSESRLRRDYLNDEVNLRSDRSEAVLPRIKVMKLSEADPYQLRGAHPKTRKKQKKDLQSLLSTIET